jgi:cytosine/adenosine deaminase-related metal-dependent hydrolase
VLQGDRIGSISGTTAVPALALDAQGGYLIPGLWDMHVHVHNAAELALYIANGVTGIRIMSGDRDEQGFRAALARQPVAPEIYLASAIVDGPDAVWPGSIEVKKPADARNAVDAIKASGADFIKVYDRIPRDAYFALAEQSKKLSIPFAGHVPEQITAQEASAAGQRSMEHLKGIAFGCSSQQAQLMTQLAEARFFLQKMAVAAEALRSVDPPKCQALFDAFIRNDTWQVPTLMVNRMWGRLDDQSMLRDPRLQYIGKAVKSRWEDRTQFQVLHWNERDFGLARGLFASDKKLVALMYRTGVPMMAGTDAGNPYVLPGFSLHEELSLLVESGLTPAAALRMATFNPAKFLGRIDSEGSIGPGKIANLVLLDADPLTDIRNTARIRAEWVKGKYYDRDALDQMLETAREQARKR